MDVNVMKSLPGGKILFAGKITDKETQEEDLALACYQPNGSPDLAFGQAGLLQLDRGSAYESIWDIHVNADSCILLSGSSHDRSLIIKLLPYLHFPISVDTSTVNNFELIHLYPNLIQDVFNLEYTLSHAQKIQVRLFSLIGQEVATLLEKPQLKGVHSPQLTLPPDLTPGWYLLALEGQTARQVVKVLIQP